MSNPLEGDWALDHSEKYDDFLKAAGMNSIKRAMAVKVGGGLTISRVGENKLKVKAVNGPKTKEREMPLGEMFEDDGVDGGTAKGTMNFEGDKLIGRFTTGKGKKFVLTREIQGGMLVQTMDLDGVSCKRFYKRK